jgi:hypothetical protein
MEDIETKEEMPGGPPPPLEDDYLEWMVGRWEGRTRSPMGGSKEKMACEMGLSGQFLLIDFESVIEGRGTYSGKGAVTVDAQGDLVGWWIDSWRTMSRGKGRRKGNVVTMVWEDSSGKQTRVVEMLGEAKRRETITMLGPDGREIEAISEMTRVKK